MECNIVMRFNNKLHTIIQTNFPNNAEQKQPYTEALRGGNGNSLHYSSWRIQWREWPGGLQSIGSANSQPTLKQGSTLAHNEQCVCVCVCVCVCACIIKIPGGGHGNPLQYPFLENPMERGTWWATVHRICKELSTTVAT